MDIKQLKLHNFWSHKDSTINFDKDFYMILGKMADTQKSNGSGKSTVARGIAYALYGDASSEIKNDAAIYNDAEKMGVMLSFELNGIDYIIKRKVIRGSSPTIHITVGEDEEVKYGVKAGQEAIIDILGADYTIYKNTSYFKQGDINSFSSLSPKEAKEIVMKILQLDVYNEYEKVAKDKSKEIDSEIISLNNSITDLETRINEETLANEKPSVTEKDLKALEKEFKEIKNKQQEAEELAEGKEAVLEEVNKKFLKIKTLMDKTQFQIDERHNRIEKLKKLCGTCPTCEHVLDEIVKSNIILGIKKEMMPFCAEVLIYNEEFEKIQEELKEANAIKVDTFNYSGDISTISYKIGEVKEQLKQIKASEDKLESLKVQRLTLVEALEGLKGSQAQYLKLQKAFGKNGIQAYIIENVIPEIQATTNDILSGLDTGIRINIDSQKELKKGGKAETLNINVITEFGERPYTNYSGGEKTFIDFALRIALSIILTRRSQCKIQTLILDEVFGELDTVNKRIISRALRFIANRFDFKKILIISHAEELQDSFENVIRVVFDGKSSYIK